MRRKLTEWIDTYGNKVTYNKQVNQSATNQASTSSAAADANNKKLWHNFVDAATEYLNATGSGSYIIDHYGGVCAAVLDIEEVSDDGTDRPYYEFFFNFVTGKFKFKKGYGQGSSIEVNSGYGFNNMLDVIKKISVDWFDGFDFDTLKESLNEWLDNNGNKISSASVVSNVNTSYNTSYKEKFKKLLDYHKSHRAYSVVRSETKKIQDDGFHHMDHIKNSSEEFDHDVIVNINKNDNWTISVFKDGTHVKYRSHYGNGYENLINALRNSLVIPVRGTSEYQELLESVNTSIVEDFQLYKNLWDSLN